MQADQTGPPGTVAPTLPSPSTRGAGLDVATLCRFADLAVEGLSAAREEVDALNVYPVPDGDTGTNMFLTVEAARSALRDALHQDGEQDGEQDGPDALRAYARGALLGARGNSGVILSQLVGALLRRIADAGTDERPADVVADGLRRASDAAWAAVGRPVEGTILSVARAAADAAADSVQDPRTRLGDVVHVAHEAARVALARTPEQLELLARAGVVDAGGRGLCLVLEAAEAAITGRRPAGGPRPRGHEVGHPALPATLPTGDLTEDGPAYEVMYLLEAADPAVTTLREELDPLGDSLVVVGGEGLWNVHVHVDDVGAAVEAGIRAGRPRRISVTHFAEQAERSRDRRRDRTGRGLVVVAAGPGLEELYASAGAQVITAAPGRRPGTTELLAAVEATGCAEVLLLPNDVGGVEVARAAAHEAEARGIHVVVIPTRAQVQGIAALAVHEPGRPLDSDVVHMTAAARGTRHGAVTVAVRAAMTTAGPCAPGDCLGVVDGDFVIVGRDLFEVACGVLERLFTGGGGELVTLVAGADAGDLAQACEHWVGQTHPGVDVVVHEGGQDRYPLLVAVE